MLEKYIDWDEAVKKMIGCREENQIKLENLYEELEEITQSIGSIGSMDYSKPRVNGTAAENVQDAIVNQMLHQQQVQQKINELKKEDAIYTRAWNALSEDERRILQEFFQAKHDTMQGAVDVLCKTYGFERTKIYDLRKATLHKFKRFVAG